MQANGFGRRMAAAAIAAIGVVACSTYDDDPPSMPPSLDSIAGHCRTAARENSPAMYRCYGRSIRAEPLYDNDNRDLYAVLAAKADVIAEQLERRQISVAEARLQWETAKSDARSEAIRRAPPPPPAPPGP